MIEEVLHERAFNGVSHQQISTILQRCGSIEAAHAAAQQYAIDAREAISTFPESEIKRALLWIPEFVVERRS